MRSFAAIFCLIHVGISFCAIAGGTNISPVQTVALQSRIPTNWTDGDGLTPPILLSAGPETFAALQKSGKGSDRSLSFINFRTGSITKPIVYARDGHFGAPALFKTPFGVAVLATTYAGEWLVSELDFFSQDGLLLRHLALRKHWSTVKELSSGKLFVEGDTLAGSGIIDPETGTYVPLASPGFYDSANMENRLIAAGDRIVYQDIYSNLQIFNESAVLIGKVQAGYSMVNWELSPNLLTITDKNTIQFYSSDGVLLGQAPAQCRPTAFVGVQKVACLDQESSGTLQLFDSSGQKLAFASAVSYIYGLKGGKLAVTKAQGHSIEFLDTSMNSLYLSTLGDTIGTPNYPSYPGHYNSVAPGLPDHFYLSAPELLPDGSALLSVSDHNGSVDTANVDWILVNSKGAQIADWQGARAAQFVATEGTKPAYLGSDKLATWNTITHTIDVLKFVR